LSFFEEGSASPGSSIFKEGSPEDSAPVSPISQSLSSVSSSPILSPLNLSTVDKIQNNTTKNKENTNSNEHEEISKLTEINGKDNTQRGNKESKEITNTIGMESSTNLKDTHNNNKEISIENNKINANTQTNKKESDAQLNYAVIIKIMKTDLNNPITFKKIIETRLPNIAIIGHPTLRFNGVRIQFKDKDNQQRFLQKFKDADFGPKAEIIG